MGHTHAYLCWCNACVHLTHQSRISFKHTRHLTHQQLTSITVSDRLDETFSIFSGSEVHVSGTHGGAECDTDVTTELNIFLRTLWKRRAKLSTNYQPYVSGRNYQPLVKLTQNAKNKVDLTRHLLGGALNAPTFFAALYLRNGAPQARQILGTCCELIAVYDSEVLKLSVQKFLRY